MSEARRALTLALLVALAATARADVLPLEELLAQAAKRRPVLEADQARVDEAAGQVALAHTGALPTLSAVVDGDVAPGERLLTLDDPSGGSVRVPGVTPLGEAGAFTPRVRYGATLTLRGTLYDFGRTAAAVQAAGAELDAARAGAAAGAARIRREVRAAYLAWLVAAADLDVLRESADETTARRGLVAIRVEEGTRPASDLPVARLDELRAGLELTRARTRLASARLALEAAAGAPLPSGATPDPTWLEAATPADAPADAPEARALERRRDAALAQAADDARRHAPVLSVLAELGGRGQDDELFPAYRLGLSLAFPLWDGGARSARAARARALARELDAGARETRQAHDAERARLQAELAGAGERIAAAQALADTASEILGRARERLELGVGSVEAVVEARATWTRARREVLAARAARAEAALGLIEP